MPLVGFLPANDPRVLGTVDTIQQRLCIDGLVLRYDTGAVEDGLPPGKARFSPAAFGWPTILCCRGAEGRLGRCLNDCSHCAMTSVCSPKSYDRRARRMLGNFPQAFSHVALVNTALNLTRATGNTPADQRGDGEGRREAELRL